jgi:hypothetical protein
MLCVTPELRASNVFTFISQNATLCSKRMADMFDRIPAELRSFGQWILWKTALTDAGKPTKIPVNPWTGSTAEVDNPATWGTFEQAVSIARNYPQAVSGIGFVFTDNDPFAGIDLDSPYDPALDPERQAAVLARHQRIVSTFNSYSEWSPSGQGAHIIIRASVPSGRRREKVELYSSKRFFTFTGNVFVDAPIADRNYEATVLWEEIGGDQSAHLGANWNYEQTRSDAEVLQSCSNAANGELFRRLYAGDFSGYPSQSEADQALVNILCFFTDNREQVSRLFLQSGLGTRDKAKRTDYREATITKGFDQKVAAIDVEAFHSSLRRLTEAKLAQPEPIPANELLPPPELPTGLLGDVASFLYEAAPRPVPEIALVGAIGLLAGVCGRAFNVSGTGLNQYILLLADTGRGKDAIANGVARLMTAVAKPLGDTPSPSDVGFHSAQNFVGPGEIASAPALLKHLETQPSFVSIIGEMGFQMRKWAGDRASPNDVMVRRLLLDLYGKSGYGSVAREIIYSKKEDNTKIIQAPALSILGESTAARFLDAIDEDMIAEGLLPRFLTMEFDGDRPNLNANSHNVIPPVELLTKLRDLTTIASKKMHENAVINVRFTSDAMHFADEFNAFCDNEINRQKREVHQQLWNRAHLKLIKLAALYAVGDNWHTPEIQLRHVQWAKAIIVRDVERMLKRFENGEIGNQVSESKQHREIKRVCAEFLKKPAAYGIHYGATLEQWQQKTVPYAYISRRLINSKAFREDRIGATGALKKALRDLCDQGVLNEISQQRPTAHGPAAKLFTLNDLSILDQFPVD